MHKKLQILLVAPQPFMQDRGTPIAVRILCESLALLGHTIHLLVYHEGGDIHIDGVTIHRIANIKWVKNIRPGLSWKKIICDLFVLIKMLELKKKHHFDLVHAVEEAVFLAKIFKTLYGMPFIYDMDSSLSEQVADKVPALGFCRYFMERVEKYAIKDSLGIVAVCGSLEEKVKRMVPDSMVVRLEDISLLNDNKVGEEDVKAACNITGLCMLYVGNLEKYQGIELLLHSFSLTLKETTMADLVIIGGTESDIFLYKKLTKELGIDAKVHFLGPRDLGLLGYYLKQADILVSPRTHGHNTPMKIYSYLASGIPILATQLPTHTQVLDSSVACLAPANKKAMAKQMIDLITNKELREQIGKNGKRLAEEKYSLQAFHLKVKDFYAAVEQKIISQKNNS